MKMSMRDPQASILWERILCPLGVNLRARGEFLLIDSKHLYFKMQSARFG